MLTLPNRTHALSIGAQGHTRRTLGQRFDPRRNSLTLMRLILAVVVALVHASVIGWGDQPSVGSVKLGTLAVDGFFVISGFLVTRSALRLPTLRRYVWHRFLRIMPGFWVCLLVTALGVAPLVAWLQGRSPAVVFGGEESSVQFLLNNAALLMRQWDIAGLTAGDRAGAAMNGALWTLWYEALCYVLVVGLIVFGLVRRRGRATPVLVRALRGHGVLAVTAAVWLWVAAQAFGVVTFGPEILPRFLLLFLLGALGLIYAHRITFTAPVIGAAAVTWIVGMLAMPDYRPMGAAGFAYLLLWAMVALPWRHEPPADVSYGIYVYHWPVQLVLVNAGLASAGRVVFTVSSVLAAGMIAFVSWRVVEAPSLARKNALWIDRLPLRPWRRDRGVRPGTATARPTTTATRGGATT